MLARERLRKWPIGVRAPWQCCAQTGSPVLRRSRNRRRNHPASGGDGSPSAPPTPGSRAHDVYEILRLNLEREKKSGWYHVEPTADGKRRRRVRIYWITLAAIDIPFSVIAWVSGPGDPFVFVCAIAGIGYFSGRLTWETWFLRTD